MPPGGIANIEPEKKDEGGLDIGWGALKGDLNGDGVVDAKDLEIARNTPGLGWLVKIIEGIIAGTEDLRVPEKVGVPGPSFDDISTGKFEGMPPGKTKEKEKITEDKETETDEGGITTLPEVSEEQKTREGEDEWTGIGPNEQKLYKQLAAERAKNTGQPDSGGITDKKDVPAWALPMMSAGFAMMASKSPNFLQALGEGGQEGIKTLTAQQEGKLEKEKSEAQIKKDLAWADYYTAGGASGKPTIITDSQGRKIYAVLDKKTNTWKPITTASGKPQYVVRSIPEIEKYLATIHGPAWIAMSVDDRQKLVEAEINKDLGIAITNVQSSTGTEDTGPGVFGKIWEGIQEGVTAKDGGIVSLRR